MGFKSVALGTTAGEIGASSILEWSTSSMDRNVASITRRILLRTTNSI